MDYKNTSPNWQANGVEPPETLKQQGFIAGYKPPATYFNWLLTRISRCIEEIQSQTKSLWASYDGVSEVVGDTLELTTKNKTNLVNAVNELVGLISEIDNSSVGAIYDENGGEIFNDYSTNKAQGKNSHAEGTGSVANGNSSHAEGHTASAIGDYSHAEGIKTNAVGYGSHSEGGETSATHYYAHAEGYQSKAVSHYTHAEGLATTAIGEKSHAEGNGTTASGESSHAEGEGSTASALCSHAQGFGTRALGANSSANGARTTALGAYATSDGFSSNIATDIIADLSVETTNDEIKKAWTTSKFSLAKNIYSKVNGTNCLALHNGAEASGDSTIASGVDSRSKGIQTIASGSYSEAGGVYSVSSGYASTANGGRTVAIGDYSMANGLASNTATDVIPDLTKDTDNSTVIEAWENTKFSLAKGGYSSVTGNNCLALGAASTATGTASIASGNSSYASGCQTTASGNGSIATGGNTVASGEYSQASGNNTQATGDSSKASGYKTQAIGEGAVAEGYNTVASGSFSYAGGNTCNAEGNYSRATGGYSTVNLNSPYSETHGYATGAGGFAQAVFGRNNVEYSGAKSAEDTSGTAFIIGVGTSTDTQKTPANAFRVTNDGKCMGSASFSATGADYAELYEWLDGNLDNEDRRGCFVTLDGNKIRKANTEDDYILGVISCTPAVVGNAYTDMWQGMYLTDVFGKRLIETVEIEETIDAETGDVIPAHTETRFILNPDYDTTQQYISREDRKEWGYVGTHGQLVVIDDNTCKVNGYCKITDNGTATSSDVATDYRVIERLDDNHIRIVIK